MEYLQSKLLRKNLRTSLQQSAREIIVHFNEETDHANVVVKRRNAERYPAPSPSLTEYMVSTLSSLIYGMRSHGIFTDKMKMEISIQPELDTIHWSLCNSSAKDGLRLISSGSHRLSQSCKLRIISLDKWLNSNNEPSTMQDGQIH